MSDVVLEGGLVMDPFCGSGSTGKACRIEGMEFVGIEREPAYVAIARARIAHVDPEEYLKNGVATETDAPGQSIMEFEA